MKFALVLLVLALCGTVQGRDGKWLILSIHLIWFNNLSYCDIYFSYNWNSYLAGRRWMNVTTYGDISAQLGGQALFDFEITSNKVLTTGYINVHSQFRTWFSPNCSSFKKVIPMSKL